MPSDTIKVKTKASLTKFNIFKCLALSDHCLINKALLIIHTNWGKPEIIHHVDTTRDAATFGCKDAVSRKHKKLPFETVYNHEIILKWLQEILPLYILCYVFDSNELSMKDMQNATEETAQYSLHVVGLVMHRRQRISIVADPN